MSVRLAEEYFAYNVLSVGNPKKVRERGHELSHAWRHLKAKFLPWRV